ncbi:hypothetical protein GCK72_006403 [Caenorhabditis remanei]|uniref:DUF38 domain-containing protein n=1 Tax=Caenorhabditis remanei TaxID=31234 RepID=A0A6A5HID8_CAERE|nr:hypothetical protein GCK72_006403 [Caenorhabditis remanei]KAF1766446.1 hypothetical protein GCK72_006403 [Caenorhabditis remanei]
MQEIVDSWAPRVTDMELWDNWNITESTIPSQEVECDEDSNQNWMSLFKNPKLRLETLMLNCWTRNKLRFLERNCFNHKIHVKKFKMRAFCSITSTFLNMLDRETLEEVSLPITRESVEKLDEFLCSDHLKDIKMLNISTDLCPSELPLINFFQNLPRLTIEFVGKGVEGRWDDFKDRFIKKLADFIKYFLNSTQLQFCHLTGRFSLDMESIMIELQSREIMVPGFPDVRRYPILGSNEFYEIEFNGGGYGGYGILHGFEIQIKRKQ